MDITLFSMRKTSIKIFVATLFAGLVFLVGGVVIQAQETNVFAYTYQFKLMVGENSGTITSISFLDFAACNVHVPPSGSPIIDRCKSYTQTDWQTMFNKNETITAAYNKQVAVKSGLQGKLVVPDDLPGANSQAATLLASYKCTGFVDCMINLPSTIALFFAYIAYILSAAVLTIAGYLFNAVLFLSINKDFIDQDFIDDMWIIVRDFSNMVFIFVLLYAGIQTMFGAPGWGKTVIRVVIIALLINFSLFFTKVIIDTGNILAVTVYESMGVKSDNQSTTLSREGGLEERSLSESLVTTFGPQNIFNVASAGNSPSLIVAVFIIGIVLNLLIAWALFRVAVIFVGRIIGFWFLMIISPFAFISTTIPQLQGNFDKWLSNLIGLAFVAPVFLFFLYLIMTALTKGTIISSLANPTDDGANDFSLNMLFVSVVMVLFIYMALEKSVEFAKSMSGSFGDVGAKIVGGAMGVVAGGAVAGSAILGSMGGLGKNADGTDKAGAWAKAARMGGLSSVAGKIGYAGRNMNFDARNIPGASSLGLGAGNKLTSASGQKAFSGFIEGVRDDIHANTPEARMAEATAKAKKKEDSRVARAAVGTTAGSLEIQRQAAEMYAARTTGHAAAVDKVNQTAIDNRDREAAQKASLLPTLPVAASGIPNTPSFRPAQAATIGLVQELINLRVSHASLEVANGGPTGTTLKTDSSASTSALEVAKMALTRNDTPGNRAAYTATKTAAETAEKRLADFKGGAEKIEKLEEKIQKYQAL